MPVQTFADLTSSWEEKIRAGISNTTSGTPCLDPRASSGVENPLIQKSFFEVGVPSDRESQIALDHRLRVGKDSGQWGSPRPNHAYLV